MFVARADQDLHHAAYLEDSSGTGEGSMSSPIVPMHFLETPQLKYNITAIDGGVLLSIWEPAVKSDIRVKPFLFMIRYRLASEGEAKKLLGHYLAVYRRATTV
jgi:hypothetical protein